MTSTWLIAVIASIIAGVLANVVASLLEKAFAQHPFVKHFSHKQLLVIVLITFIIFSLPGIYLNFLDSPRETSLINPNRSDELNINSTPNLPINIERASIEQFESAYFFENDLVVSIGDIWWGPTKINFIVGSPGYPNQFFEQVEVGFATVYEGSSIYDIRITGLDRDVFDYTVHIQVTKTN